MHACLEQIYAYADWDLGRVAILKPGSPAPLIEASLWHGNTRGRYDAFVRESDRYDISRPTGAFISVVVREMRAMWIPDFAKLRASGRLRTALVCGLHSGFAFPIIVRGEVAAILEFFAKAPRPVDPRLFGAIGSVGSQLARLIERGRAEAAHSRLATIVECSQDAIVSTAPDRTILTWNAGAERLFGYTAVESLGRDMAFLLPDERRHELGRQRARPCRLAGPAL